MRSDDGEREFWLRHVRIGTSLSLVVLGMIAAYLSATPEGSHRTLLWGLVAGGLALTAAGLLAPWPWLLEHGLAERCLVGWNLTVIVFILAGTAADGGAGSPLQVLLLLPLVFASMAYRPAAVASNGTIMVVGLLLVERWSGDILSPATLLRSATLVTIAMMCALIARSHRDQSVRLRVAAGKLHELAHHDALTGCVNRRAFEARLAQTSGDAVPVGLLLLDVDRFKDLNDTRGHLAGDALLGRLADALRGNVRDEDVVARLGGDEFAVLLPGCDGAATDEAADRFRQLFETDGCLEGVTVSVGRAHSENVGHDRERLIAMADRELYLAKAKRKGLVA